MEVTIDIDKLKQDLINYIGTSLSHNPVAIIELSNISNANSYELIEFALKNKFDLRKYIIDEKIFRK